MAKKKSRKIRTAEKRAEEIKLSNQKGCLPKENSGIKSLQRHFRTFHDAKTTHHPQYVWGEKGKDYLTIGITSSDKGTIELTRNPEPNNEQKAYINPGVNKINKGIQNEKKKGWSLANEDKKIVNQIIDDYKNKNK